MSKQSRPTYQIEADLREKMQEYTAYVRSGHYARAQQVMTRLNQLKEELEEAHADVKFCADNRNMDKAERAFFGKILNLSLNEADLALYHIEMFFAYMNNRGYVPVPEWDRRKRELMNAVKSYRDFVEYFFDASDLRVPSELNFMHLLEMVADRAFTDRERVYYDRYEVKAAQPTDRPNAR